MNGAKKNTVRFRSNTQSISNYLNKNRLNMQVKERGGEGSTP